MAPLSRYGKELDKAWATAEPSLQHAAIERAKWILGNLAHYYHGRSYEDEDRGRLAAELVRAVLLGRRDTKLRPRQDL